MGLEIERRFVVKNLPDLSTVPYHAIKQGYLSKPGDTAITRIRTVEVNGVMLGYVTIKISAGKGTNEEFEYSIPHEDAVRLLLACNDLRISKTRYVFPYKGKIFEIDVFKDYLDGVMLAEVELDSIDEPIELPDFLGTEVTGIKGLSNFAMALDPSAVKRILKDLR